jgi:drug/metabolite transporter (DMT)-like permease
LALGISFFQVFLFEVIFATLFFGLFAKRFFRVVRPTKPSQWILLVILGFDTIGVGYFLFLSFSLGPVAIGATLMFMYLPVVYAYTLLARHQKFSTAKLGAICLLLIGVVLTTEILSSFREPGALPAVGAALIASMSYALVFILTPTVATYTSAEFRSFAVSALGLVGALVVFAFIPALWFPVGDKLWSIILMTVLLGVVGQTLPVITLMKGLPMTGSSLGGVLASIELPIAIFASALLLGESLNSFKLLGVALVLAGIATYSYLDRERV